MSHHEGVSCDCCLKSSFRGRRYKCLVCFDFDLCSSCYESGSTNTRHSTNHPVQCILTRNDYELFYAGEAITIDQPQALTCPICGKMGLTEMLLQEHVTTEHSDNSAEVVCPLCAAIPGGEANNVTDDFASHLTLEHRTPRELISFTDERQPQTAIRGGRRGPHPVRTMTNPRNRRSHQNQMGSAAAAAASAAAGYSTNGVSSLSGIGTGRDPMDPISELLSQLSGVRRAANLGQSGVSAASATAAAHSHLQALQIQMERHAGVGSNGVSAASLVGRAGQPFSERSSIDRALRRHQQLTQQQQHAQHLTGLVSSAAAASGLVVGSGGPGGLGIGLIPPSALSSGAHLNNAAISPFMSLIDAQVQSSLLPHGANILASGINNIPASVSVNNSNVKAMSGSSGTNQFLLSRIPDAVLSESEQQASEIHRADRSLFVQELILSTIAGNIDLTGEFNDDEGVLRHETSADTLNQLAAENEVMLESPLVDFKFHLSSNRNSNSALNSLAEADKTSRALSPLVPLSYNRVSNDQQPTNDALVGDNTDQPTVPLTPLITNHTIASILSLNSETSSVPTTVANDATDRNSSANGEPLLPAVSFSSFDIENMLAQCRVSDNVTGDASANEIRADTENESGPLASSDQLDAKHLQESSDIVPLNNNSAEVGPLSVESRETPAAPITAPFSVEPTSTPITAPANFFPPQAPPPQLDSVPTSNNNSNSGHISASRTQNKVRAVGPSSGATAGGGLGRAQAGHHGHGPQRRLSGSAGAASAGVVSSRVVHQSNGAVSQSTNGTVSAASGVNRRKIVRHNSSSSSTPSSSSSSASAPQP